jgi:hypothetical protein
MDHDSLRAQYLAELRAAAERRFGATRAAALEPLIADAAGWMAEVATYPVDAEEPPAFYAEPSS